MNDWEITTLGLAFLQFSIQNLTVSFHVTKYGIEPDEFYKASVYFNNHFVYQFPQTFHQRLTAQEWLNNLTLVDLARFLEFNHDS